VDHDGVAQPGSSGAQDCLAVEQRLAGLLLADLPPGMGLLGLGRVQAELEAILGAKVDLVPASDLKPAVRARVEPELVAL